MEWNSVRLVFSRHRPTIRESSASQDSSAKQQPGRVDIQGCHCRRETLRDRVYSAWHSQSCSR
jgi:hypothetical protein